MAVKDIRPINYSIPRLKFNVKPGKRQTFDVKYGIYQTDVNNVNWIEHPYSAIFDLNGNCADKLVFENFEDNTEYIIDFYNDEVGHFYTKFKTGINIALGDSPYYDKLLIPGQIYEWFTDKAYRLSNPDTHEADPYYGLQNNKAASDSDNWGSMNYYRYTTSGYLAPYEDDRLEGKTLFVNHADKHDRNIPAFQFNNTKSDHIILALPNFKIVDGALTPWKSYLTEEGGGGICARDVLHGGFKFVFCISEPSDENITICSADSSTVNGHKSTDYIKLVLSGNSLFVDRQFKGEQQSILITNDFPFDTWLGCSISTSGLTIDDSSINGDNVLGNDIFPNFGDPLEIFEFDTAYKKITPFTFGDATTKNLFIARVGKYSEDTFDIFFNTNMCLKVECDGKSYLQSNKYTTLIKRDRIGFLVDSDMIAEGGPFNHYDYNKKSPLTISIMSGDTVIETKTLNGFDYTKDNGNNVHIGGIISPAQYLEDSYDLIFSKANDPINALSSYFFTKHGTWGGYNGGVNGYNIYFNAAGHLVLENHGDKYSGSLPGVAKESVKPSEARTYTGYGPDLDLAFNIWDKRTNKDCLRSGSAIVSNKYYTYGRIDITMKIPVGCWGVCPAIWFFHYVEIGDTDFRFDDATNGYTKFNKQGSQEDGFYRVINNEIDIELPSHLTNGTLSKWSELANCYFDPNTIDDQLCIGITGETDGSNGLYRCINTKYPNLKSSWKKISNIAEPRYHPSFQNCKLNNWIGELNSGDGWTKPQNGVTAEEYYKGTGSSMTEEKEEYQSQLTHVSDNFNGFADGKFHKWSIVWLPKDVVLLVDDQIIRINKGFIPFNIMKLTVAGWFPTMKIVNKKDETGAKIENEYEGVKDSDGIHGTKGAILKNINNNANTSIGTWAGTQADWEVLHLEISEIKYDKYDSNTEISFGPAIYEKGSIPDCAGTLGESFPESGLRQFLHV